MHVPLLLVVLFKPAQDYIGFYRDLHRITRPGDAILHDADDPYRQGEPVWYYRPAGARIISTKETGAPLSGRLLFVSRERDSVLPTGMEAKLLHSSLRAWLLRFNIGGWADRATVWRIWEVTRFAPDPPPVPAAAEKDGA